MITNRERLMTYVLRTLDECVTIGVSSVFIVGAMSLSMGAVMAIQLHYNITSPFLGDFLVGYTIRNISILEMSPTVMAIIFAGKVGSNIAVQLSSMRISEQIDALEIMGVNSASYLALPKIIATVLMYPLLVIISVFLIVYGGFITVKFVLPVAPEDYIHGLQHNFDSYTIYCSYYKSLTFAFLISSISAYRGFYTTGGAVEVGRAGTRAVTDSCIAILLADYFLTQLLLHSLGGP